MASKGTYLRFELHRCQGWQYPEDLFKGVKLVVDLAQLRPLEGDMIENPNPQPGKPAFANSVAKDLKTWFDQGYYFRETWDAKNFERVSPKEGVGGFFRTSLKESWATPEPVWDHTVDIQLFAQGFGETYNMVEFSCGLHFAKPVLLHWLDEVDTLFQKFAQPLIEQLKPEYALITESDHLEAYGRDVLKAKLKSIYWINYFGPIYIQKYGEEIFLTAPIWRVERLGEGVWYQLTERFLDFKDKSLQEQVLAHFKPIGVKAIA